MPDKWEYPWFAAWDLAFHMIPFSKIDPDFAKKQLTLFLREWYMHPNGQISAINCSSNSVHNVRVCLHQRSGSGSGSTRRDHHSGLRTCYRQCPRQDAHCDGRHVRAGR